MKKPIGRTVSQVIRMTPAQKKKLAKWAKGMKLTVSHYARWKLFGGE